MTMAAVAKAILVVAKAVAREENMAVVRGAHTARQYIRPRFNRPVKHSSSSRFGGRRKVWWYVPRP
jgi:hypothetical protein